LKRPVLIAGLVALALTVGAIFLLLNGSQGEPLKVGDKAPDFHLDGAFGGSGDLSDMQGKIVILNFWATWCSPCIEEMPSLEKLYHKFEDDDFEIVAVALDKEGAPVVRQFAQRYKLSFALVVDPHAETQDTYHLMGVPETYVLDKDGVILERILGPKDWNSPETVRKFAGLLGREPAVQAPSANTGATFQIPPALDFKSKPGGAKKAK
jgi:peroxiredoxin